MNPHLILSTIAPVIVLLGFGILSVVATRHAGVSPVVGYLVLGAVLHGFGMTILGSPTVEILAELGLVLLLFDTGLHFSLTHVREQLTSIFGLGPVQVLIGAIAIGAVGVLFGLPVLPALLVGATLALSSTAVVERIIAERRQQNCPVGLTAIAILLYQDLAAIFLLVITDALGTGEAVLPEALLALVKATCAFAFAVLLARVAVRPLFDLLARSRNEEVFPAAALAVALSAGWATGAAGLPLTLGAFLGGMVIAETPYQPIIRSEIRPFRGLLLGFFFVFVGSSLDMHMVLNAWPALLGITLLLIIVKVCTNAMASLMFRWSLPGSLQLGFLLAQGSEIAFVIFSLPQVRVAIGQRPASLLIASVTLTLAVTPNLAELGRILAAHLRQRRNDGASHELVETGHAAPVFIAGMGERGRTVADALNDFAIGYAATDHDPRRLGLASADGYSVEFGDIGDTRLWESLAMAGRRLLVLTEPTWEVSRDLTPLARQFFPDVIRLAAVGNEQEAARFEGIGVEPLIDRDGRGVDLAAHVLSLLHVGEGAITEWRERRARREAITRYSPKAGEAALAGVSEKHATN